MRWYWTTVSSDIRMVPYWIPKARLSEKSESEWVRFLPKWVRKFNWSHLQVYMRHTLNTFIRQTTMVNCDQDMDKILLQNWLSHRNNTQLSHMQQFTDIVFHPTNLRIQPANFNLSLTVTNKNIFIKMKMQSALVDRHCLVGAIKPTFTQLWVIRYGTEP